MLRPALAGVSLLLLTACAPRVPTPATVLGGECKLNHTPEYEVLGRTPYDQKWIVRTTESLVVGCHQPRPKKRPASWVVGTVAPAPQPPAPVKPEPNKTIWDRVRGR